MLDRPRLFHTDSKTAVEGIRHGGGRVLAFVGFSDAGYEDIDAVQRLLASELDLRNPNDWIVCAGATESGIGIVYPLAKSRRLSTVGIVSKLAETTGASFRPR